MAGKMPLFVSAPRCVLKVGDQKIAYAIGLSLNVSVEVERVKILGQYKTLAIEPLAVAPVSGTFRVVRLLSKETRDNNANLLQSNASLRSAFVGGADAKYQQAGVDTNVNFAASVTDGSDGSSVLAQSHLERHLDPETILFSQSFDLDLYLKVPVISENDFDVNGFMKPGIVPRLVETNFMMVKDCRISSASCDLTPGRLLEEPFSFEGLLAISHWDESGKPIQSSDSSWSESPGGATTP